MDRRAGKIGSDEELLANGVEKVFGQRCSPPWFRAEDADKQHGQPGVGFRDFGAGL